MLYVMFKMIDYVTFINDVTITISETLVNSDFLMILIGYYSKKI